MKDIRSLNLEEIIELFEKCHNFYRKKLDI